MDHFGVLEGLQAPLLHKRLIQQRHTPNSNNNSQRRNPHLNFIKLFEIFCVQVSILVYTDCDVGDVGQKVQNCEDEEGEVYPHDL